MGIVHGCCCPDQTSAKVGAEAGGWGCSAMRGSWVLGRLVVVCGSKRKRGRVCVPAGPGTRDGDGAVAGG